MNFVRSSEAYHSTDVSHVDDFQFNNRQGFGRGQPQWNSPAQNLRFNGPRGNYPRGPRPGVGHFGQWHDGPQHSETPPRNFSSGFSGPRPRFPERGGREGRDGKNPTLMASSRPYKGFVKQEQQNAYTESSSVNWEPLADPRQYGGFVKPQRAQDHFEGGDKDDTVNRAGSGSGSLLSHPYTRPQLPSAPGSRTMGRFSPKVEGGGPLRGAAGQRSGFRGRGRESGPPRTGSAGWGTPGSSSMDLVKIEAATKAAARAVREAVNPNAKCIVLASNSPHLYVINRLAEAVKMLKSKRPNAVDTIHSASNIAQVKICSEIESGPVVRGTVTFFCLVQFDGINVALGTGLNKRSAKIEAFDQALEKLKKPFKRIVEVDGAAKELQASDYNFPAEPPQQTIVKPNSAVISDISGEDMLTNLMQKESNVEVLVSGRKKNFEAKELCDFVIVEPQEHNSSTNGASILRRSADFSKMLLEYDFAPCGVGGAVRCLCLVEGQVLANCVSSSKVAAKNKASQIAIDELRQHCYSILVKQHCDSTAPEITKDDMFADFAHAVNSNAASMSTPIGDSNLGKKLLEKMGWTGGGIGKDGAGIEEPVTMKQVINREGLGLAAQRGIPDDFRRHVVELLENYAASDRQDDLVFAPQFRNEERVIIHNECRRLHLKSKSKGQGSGRFLVVRRKRSVTQLLDHLMNIGGESPRYKVVPPGQRIYPWRTFELRQLAPSTGTEAVTLSPQPGNLQAHSVGEPGRPLIADRADPTSPSNWEDRSTGVRPDQKILPSQNQHSEEQHRIQDMVPPRGLAQSFVSQTQPPLRQSTVATSWGPAQMGGRVDYWAAGPGSASQYVEQNFSRVAQNEGGFQRPRLDSAQFSGQDTGSWDGHGSRETRPNVGMFAGRGRNFGGFPGLNEVDNIFRSPTESSSRSLGPFRGNWLS